MKVSLRAAEVGEIAAMLRFASESDRHLANVADTPENGTVLWVATDNTRLATISRGRVDSGQPVNFAVPKRDFLIAAELVRVRQAEVMDLVIDGGSGSINLPGFLLPFVSRPGDVLRVLEGSRQLPGAEEVIVASRSDLAAVVQAAAMCPGFIDEKQRKTFRLIANARKGHLQSISTWLGYRDTQAVVACQATANCSVALDPNTLLDFVAVADQPELRLEVGVSARVPVRLTTDRGISLLVMPQESGSHLRSRFETVFADILDVNATELRPDDNGRYGLTLRSGGVVHVRLEAAEATNGLQPLIRIETALAAGIEDSHEALREINSQNQNCPFGRIFLRDGILYLETDTTLEEVNRPQLQGAIEMVGDLADRFGPLMQAFFGRPAPGGEADLGDDA